MSRKKELTGENLSEFDVTHKPIFLLTEEDIKELIRIGSDAFGEPIEDPVSHAIKKQKDQLVFTSLKDDGFLILDNSLKEKGIGYVEMVAVCSSGNGFGTALHQNAFSYVKNGGGSFVLTLTQNPAEVMAFTKAVNSMGEECFPFDRRMSAIEKNLVDAWLTKGSLGFIKRGLGVDYERGVIKSIFFNWQPKTERVLDDSLFNRFLTESNIDFDEFIKNKNAFLVGVSLSLPADQEMVK